MGFLFGEYRGEFLVSFWEFDLRHSSLSGEFCGDGGFVYRYCSEFSIQLLEFVNGWCYVLSVKVVDEVFVGVERFLPDVLLQEEVGMGRSCGCVSLYDFICSVVIRGSVCVIWDIDRSFGPIDLGVDFLKPGGS